MGGACSEAPPFLLSPPAAMTTMPEHRAIVVTMAPPNIVDQARRRGCCREFANARDGSGLRGQGNDAASHSCERGQCETFHC